MNQTVPSSPDQLSSEWVTGTLKSGGYLEPGTSVRVVEATPVGQGVGILCQLFRLSLDYAGTRPAGAPASVIAKLPSSEEQTRNLASAFKFYEREVRFYEDLARELSITVPRAFHRAFDADGGGFVLLLEDLGHMRMGDQIAGATATECDLLIRTLAAHHAKWWNSGRLNDLPWLPTAASDLNKGGMLLYPDALPAFLSQFGDRLSPGIVGLAERYASAAGGMLERFERGDRTVCHGDWRLDNFFFGRDSTDPPVAVLDWQIAIQAVGTYDLGYFMSQSVDVGTRREHEQRLLDLYHDTLVASGVRGYSRDQMIDDYRWTLLFCLTYPVMSVGFGDLANERGATLNRVMTERCLAAIEDWDCASLI